MQREAHLLVQNHFATACFGLVLIWFLFLLLLLLLCQLLGFIHFMFQSPELLIKRIFEQVGLHFEVVGDHLTYWGPWLGWGLSHSSTTSCEKLSATTASWGSLPPHQLYTAAFT